MKKLLKILFLSFLLSIIFIGQRIWSGSGKFGLQLKSIDKANADVPSGGSDGCDTGSASCGGGCASSDSGCTGCVGGGGEGGGGEGNAM